MLPPGQKVIATRSEGGVCKLHDAIDIRYDRNYMYLIAVGYTCIITLCYNNIYNIMYTKGSQYKHNNLEAELS